MAPPPKPPQYPDPPSYNEEEPPSYSSLASSSHSSAFEKPAPPAEDVLHFIDHDGDTVISLAFRYGVPVDVLRRANNITSDHLLRARRTVIIPGSHYTGGVSLSPRPLEGEEEEIRKGKIRKFMVQCKVSEYDVAVLYLEQSEWYLDGAVEAYLEDERWEREHPLKGVGVKKGISSAAAGRRRFTGQRS
jgi:LysM repeat protein